MAKFPTIADVARALFHEMQWENKHAQPVNPESLNECESSDIDVRLAFGRMTDPDAWHVFFGLVDYDPWHGKACGATSFDPHTTPTKAQAERMARDLIGQVKEQIRTRESAMV